MISTLLGFYYRAFALWSRGLSHWLRWHLRHRLISIGILILLAAVANTVCFDLLQAHADNGADASCVTNTLLPPDCTLTDSSGVPLSSYLQLPLDRGDAWTWMKGIIAVLVDFVWTIVLFCIAWMLWLIKFLLSFQWVAWIAAPFNFFATKIQTVLTDSHWIPLALLITGTVIGVALLLGRFGRGITELVQTAIILALIGGVLANPVQSLTASGGLLDIAQSKSAAFASSLVTDDPSSSSDLSGQVLSASVTSELVDLFVRVPAQEITFGHALTGDCDTAFTTAMASSPPIKTHGNDVRDAVSNCDPVAKDYVQNPSIVMLFSELNFGQGTFCLYIFAAAISVLLMVTIIAMLTAAIRSMVNAHLALAPVSKAPLWRALADVFFGVIAIFILVALLAIYLSGMLMVLKSTSVLGFQAQMTIVGILFIVCVVLLVRSRKKTLKTGRSLADQLARIGLFGGSSPTQPRGHPVLASSIGPVVSGLISRPRRQQALTAPTQIPPSAADIGEVFASRPRDTGNASQGALTTSPPSGPSGDSETGGTGSALVRLGLSAGRIAKAAPGGPGAIAAAAALEGGQLVVGKALSHASQQSEGSQADPGYGGAPMRGGRIVVDSAGVGHVEPRRPSTPAVVVYPTKVTDRPMPSPHNQQVRALLAGATKRGITA